MTRASRRCRRRRGHDSTLVARGAKRAIVVDIYPGRKARFVKNFLADARNVPAAIQAYVKAVKTKAFPGPEHGF